ncbi:MAG TPA: ecotin family protein [Thiolinea sp.]|nr:ecotin family protein [Thiolinea sp.]
MSSLKILSVSVLLTAGIAMQASYAGNQPPATQQQVDMGVTMKPFPQPHATDARLVIRLPKRQDEKSLFVRVTPGKFMTTDCNTQSYNGQLETKTAQGWGYNFYVLRTNGNAMSTMMACPPSSSSRMVFVPVAAAQQTLPYNSRMPLVYYVPKEFSIQYEVLVPQQRGTARPE